VFKVGEISLHSVDIANQRTKCSHETINAHIAYNWLCLLSIVSSLYISLASFLYLHIWLYIWLKGADRVQMLATKVKQNSWPLFD